MSRDRAPRRPRGQLMVRKPSGRRHPFLRGMVTHDLVQRGLSFDEAYAVARALRERLSEREEVSTAELDGLIAAELEQMLGAERVARLRQTDRPPAELEVRYQGAPPQPFSRGLLARSISAAGIDVDRAYRLVVELQGELRGEGVRELGSEELARRVGDLLERREGPEAAGRYRLVRRIQRLPRPLVIYIGGASGTGKSTLTLELAPLLRIYRLNATDTIRQVMRMVFSPAILPALHRSSFEAATAVESVGSSAYGIDRELTPRELTIANFEEQATRVCVGVRAVVERAVTENMSILVEGVHLTPPFIPFEDLEGAAYQLCVLLTTLDEEVHRARFLGRGRAERRAARYLEHFTAIRTLQGHLLEQAEAADVALVDTADANTALERTLRTLTGMLQQRLPQLSLPVYSGQPKVPSLLLAIDGLADRPARSLGGRTPLAAAHTPSLDRLAAEGRVGLADPVAGGVVPDTASGSLALFGQSPLAVKRGVVEALGAGLELAPTDVALRGNLATLDAAGRLVDRRAGRIRAGAPELAAALDGMALEGDGAAGVAVRVRATTEHRLAIVLQGPALSSAVSASDPGDGVLHEPPLVPRPLDPADEMAARTARLVRRFEEEARRILAEHPVNRERQAQGLAVANAVITRGAGHVHTLPRLEEGGVPLKVCCIAGDRTVLGIASSLGATCVTSAEMTANLDTSLAVKFERALTALGEHDLVVIHVKGADIAAHDRRPDLKVAFLEAVDRELAELLERRHDGLRIAVATDHATLSEVGQHAADPVPVLLWGPGIEPDAVTAFDETSAAAGGLQRFPLQLLLRRLFDLDRG